LVLLITSFAIAQNKPKLPVAAAANATNDTKAKIYLDNIGKKYKALKTIKATFKLLVENTANKLREEKKGNLTIKGVKYKVEMDGQEIICDNKTIWTYSKDENEVQVNNYEPNPNSVNPATIFTMYEKGFICQMGELVKEAGKDLQTIDLTPTDKSKSYFKIKLYIEKATQNIVKSKIFDKNGNRYTYEVIQFTPNTNIEDAFFAFDTKKHPGVEVNDIR
jgi:outer membrane lipoprotein-sorting protein